MVPNLKNRKDDIKELVLHFIKLFCENLKIKPKNIEENAILFLKEYEFKGNVRELKNIIYKAILNSRNEIISIDDIKNNISSKDNEKSEIFNKITEDLIHIYGIENSNLIFEDFEKHMIKKLLNKNNNITKISEYLGITRNTLKSKIKKYSL
jgi:DNA-binding NtrC family response regulator